MLFVPFPALLEEERFVWTDPIVRERCRVRLADAWSAVPRAGRTLEEIRVISVGSRPVYLFKWTNRNTEAIWADTGTPVSPLSAEEARHIVKRAGFLDERGRITTVDEVRDDQWTVHQRFDAHRPLYRISLTDLDKTMLYVSSQTGEVVLDTRYHERFWNYLGAVLHWLYWTPLRRHSDFWRTLLVALSALGVLVVLTGLVVGAARQDRLRLWSRTTMRWHHALGLSVGVIVLAWTVSGLLSLDNGTFFSRSGPDSREAGIFYGEAFDVTAVSRSLAAQLQAFDGLPPREIVLKMVGGRPLAIFRFSDVQQKVVHAGAAMPPTEFLDAEEVLSAVRTLRGSTVQDVALLSTGDAYYYSTIHLKRPFPVLRVIFSDGYWVYVDMRTGALETMDASRRLHRYLFQGLHSWDFAMLREHQAARYVLVIALSVLGFGLSVTGIGLAMACVRNRLMQPYRSSTSTRRHAGVHDEKGDSHAVDEDLYTNGR